VNERDRNDMWLWLVIFSMWLLTVFLAFQIAGNQAQLDRIELELKCPDSEPMTCDGEFCGCTGDPTNYRG